MWLIGCSYLRPQKYTVLFHVSLLKKYKVKDNKIHSDPPNFWEVQTREPEATLQRGIIRRGNRAVTQLLIKWKEDKSEATWEDAQKIKAKFLSFDLAGEVTLKGGLSGAFLQFPSSSGQLYRSVGLDSFSSKIII